MKIASYIIVLVVGVAFGVMATLVGAIIKEKIEKRREENGKKQG